MTSTTRSNFSLFDPALVRPALRDAFTKLDPRVQWRNPVMFVVSTVYYISGCINK